MESVLGKEHPYTLTSVYCLAYLLHHKKRYMDAEVFTIEHTLDTERHWERSTRLLQHARGTIL